LFPQPLTPPNRFAPPRRIYSAPHPVPAPFPPQLDARSTSRPASSGRDSRLALEPRRLSGGRRPSGARISPKQKRFPWPPPSYSVAEPLHRDDALDAVASGALSFKGRVEEIPNTDRTAHRFYATVDSPGAAQSGSDRASWQDAAFKNISLSLLGENEGNDESGSLEYPNMLFAFGRGPGTTTLTWFVGQRGDLRTPTAYGSRAKPRRMKLIAILERLRELEQGLEEVSKVQFR
jgi:hypothetical protein